MELLINQSHLSAGEKTKKLDGNLSIGGCGFFECINNQKAANLLFETSRKWLKSNNIEGMDGPINFGERD